MPTALLIVTVINAIIVLIIVFETLRIVKKEQKLFEQEKKVLSASSSLPELTESHQQALKIVEEAVEKSKDILARTENFKINIEHTTHEAFQQSTKQYLEELEKHSQEISASYQELFNDLKRYFETGEAQVIEKFEDNAEQNIEEFRKSLTQSAKDFQKTLTQKVQEEFSKVESEVQVYQQQRYAEIDNSVKLTVIRVTKKIFGESIPVETQEKLVYHALEKMKSEGVFKSWE